MSILRPLVIAAVTSLSLVLAACSSEDDDSAGGPTVIAVWAHDGTDAEQQVLEGQVAAFNASQDSVFVKLRVVAEGDYNLALQSAVAKRELPDVAEVDGPLLAGYVYQDALVPLEDLLPPPALSKQLPSLQTQGSLAGHTYAVGTFDSGLGLFADRRALRAAGVEWPTSIDDAWTAAEFTTALAALARHDNDGKVLDVKLNYGVGEWLTYGFSPLVASAGGDLIDARSLSPAGHLDGSATKKALETLRGWASYVDANVNDDAFIARRVAISWVGHWEYRKYAEALGNDLVVLPLPDLGHGTKTGQGSWTWTVTAEGEARQRAAAKFLGYLLRDEEVLRMTDVNGAVPGNTSALAASDLYDANGALRLLADQLLRSCRDAAPTDTCVAVPRPVTPGYAVLTGQFATAVSVALSGADPRTALAEASTFVALDLEANRGFR